MENILKIHSAQSFKIHQLTRTLAEKYLEDIISALDLIPEVDPHTPEDVLSENSRGRILHSKWDHSLIALTTDNTFAGIIIGYERESEKNEQYPSHSIYISGFAVSKNFQEKGLGKFMLQTWIDQCREKGFVELSGELRLAVQTNKEGWNRHVQKLYESFGFKKIAEKQYGNRIDNVYSLEL